jgi:hypothetical protein
VIAASQRGASDIARLIEGIVANLDTPLPAPEAVPAAPSEESVPV